MTPKGRRCVQSATVNKASTTTTTTTTQITTLFKQPQNNAQSQELTGMRELRIPFENPNKASQELSEKVTSGE